ncbi:hypothetical protein ACQP2F_32360 [Actinoplanes sp. CA-030573]|uniref:hypothetical protein n=1 Tax=Actinoplanes sp. CA-030573 TaxID=3239898 RepID=UPI003D93FF23
MSEVLHAHAEFFAAAMTGGAMPNPSRSFVIGDPAVDTLVYGCVLDLLGAKSIEPGSSGEVSIRLIPGQALPSLDRTWPLWSGRVLGELSDLRRVAS